MSSKSLLEQGAFGKVYKTRVDNQPVAVKKVPLQYYSATFENETFIGLQITNLHHCVTFQRSFIDGEYGYIVMELCKTDMYKICKNADHIFTERQAALMFYKICVAVLELHSNGVAHLDLKLENILLDEHDDVKLCDFGTAANFKKKQKIPRPVQLGTPVYIAPEIERHKFRPDKADVWSLGIILHLLTARCYPMIDRGHVTFISESNLTFDFCNNLSKQCRNLIKSLLQFDPEARPSVKAILRHPWIKTHTTSFKETQRIYY